MRETSAIPDSSRASDDTSRADLGLPDTQAERLRSVSDTLIQAAAGSTAVDAETLETIASLLHAATHDALTGLPTRALLLERLGRELARSADGRVAVLFVDLDNFKLVNDSLGHQSGDLVLVEMARRIRACVGAGDTVSRFGGDEMVVLHPGAVDGSEVVIGAQILAAMGEPIMVHGREVVVSASVGIAICERAAQSAEQLLRDADTALYSAKSRGRNRLERFNDDLHARVARRVQIESDLRAALRDAQVFVNYQPQVDLRTGRMVGIEALARWRHPEYGLVPPTEFIRVAEECRLIGALGRQVLRTACRQLAEWVALSDSPLTMTVNVSPCQLEDPDFIAEIRDVLRDTGVNPASLCLELTESALMTRETDTVEVLERIRAMGLYVAIDDFGTQYSSLARLRGLPVEVLKIDRSFIDGLPAESGDTAVVTSILSLALAMGKHVIAEGVERPEQAIALSHMGCTVAQGYLFSAPVDPERIPQMLGSVLWQQADPLAVPIVAMPVDRKLRRGHRAFIDEFLEHIGAPMGVKQESPP